MNEFIEEFGKENFIIIMIVVALIILALITIIIIEKIQKKKALKQEIEEIEYVKKQKEKREQIKKEETKKEEVIIKEEQVQEIKEEQVQEAKETLIEEITEPLPEENKLPNEALQLKYERLKEKMSKSQKQEIKNEGVVYVEETNTKEKAKEKLEEVTRKLIEEENNLIEHTTFEDEQEEASIISYEELIKASHNIDEKNDALLGDEGEEPITIEELYKKHVEEQNIIEEENKEIKVNNPVFVDESGVEKRFKNSEIISPVYGYKRQEGLKKATKKEPSAKEVEKAKKDEMKDIEVEIRKTEKFLSELKKLRNKLD